MSQLELYAFTSDIPYFMCITTYSEVKEAYRSVISHWFAWWYMSIHLLKCSAIVREWNNLSKFLCPNKMYDALLWKFTCRLFFSSVSFNPWIKCRCSSHEITIENFFTYFLWKFNCIYFIVVNLHIKRKYSKINFFVLFFFIKECLCFN